MGTAYKYVERAADDQINWAEVGSNFSNTLKAEAELRERKKAAIDEASREYQKVLLDVPQGENSGQNKFALDAADTLTQQALIQNTLLKSGQLDPRRYMITRQNMVDGTEAAFSMFEDYNVKFKEINALKAQNLPYREQLSALGEYSMASIEGYGNFHQTQLVVNPNNGIVSMAKMIPDPSYKGSGEAPLIPDLNNLMTVASMKNRTQGRILKFDVIGSAEGFTGSLGEDKRVFMENIGSKYTAAIFKTVSDASQKPGGLEHMPKEELQSLATRLSTPEKPVTVADLQQISLYTEAKKNYIESQMVGDNAAASTLVDYKAVAPSGKTYKIMETTPENLALRDAEDGSGSHIILVKNQNGMMVPNLTEDQKADASRVLDVAIDSGMDYEETVTTAFTGKEAAQPSTAELGVRAKTKREDDLIQLWNEYFTASPERRPVVLNAILTSPQAKEQGLIDINFIDIVDPKDSTKTIEAIEMRFNGENAVKNRTGAKAQPVGNGPDAWALSGTAIHGVTDSARRMKGLTAESQRNDASFTGGNAKYDEAPGNAVDAAYAIMTADMRKDKIEDMTDDDVIAPALAKIGKKFGIVVTDGINTVTITKPGQEAKEFSQYEVEAMMSYMLTDISEEIADRYIKSSQNTGGTGGGGGVNGGAYN